MLVVAQQAAADTDNTTAWLTFVGALLVASLAAATAQWRLRVQLRHDRELHDLGELRAVLDEAAAMTYAALDKLGDALVATDEWYRAEKGLAQRELAVQHARREAFGASWPMENMAARLALRLTNAHPVYLTFQRFHHECRAAVRRVPLERPDEAGVEAIRAFTPALRESRQAFVEEAHRVVATRVESA